MRALGLFLLLPLAGCHVSAPSTPPPPALTYKVGFTWKNMDPVCSATVTKSCAQVVIAKDLTTGAVLSNSIPAGETSFTTPTVQTQAIHTYQFESTGLDADGNPITSPPATTTVNVP